MLRTLLSSFTFLLFTTMASAADYTLTLSGQSTAECSLSTSATVDAKSDGTYALQDGDITDFACTITETDPDLVLDENDLQYPAGLDYRVSNGKVTALDLQTTTDNQLQIGIAEVSKIGDRWKIFGTGSLLLGKGNKVAIAEGVVPAENNAPMASDDAMSVSQGIETAIYVLNNDTDTDTGDTLTISDVTQPSDGTAAISGGGLWVTYMSEDPFTGNPDVFTYTVSDGTDTDVGTVTVTRVTGPLTLAEQAATMAPGEWKQLVTVNEFNDIAVTETELIAIETEKGGYDIGGTSGSGRVLQAWSGAGWDPTGNRFFFFGGGHASYGGNEVIEFDVDTLTWARKSQPHALTLYQAAVAGPPSYPEMWLPEDVSPADGVADTPGAPHTYDMLSFNSTTGKLVVPQHKSIYPMAGGSNFGDVFYLFDPDAAPGSQWTVHDGHFYRQANCEYIPEEGYSYCMDGVGTSYHELYVINDDGTETNCGRNLNFNGAGPVGMVYRDDDTGVLYDFRYNILTRVTLEADECDPTFTTEATIPTLFELGTPWDFVLSGVASGYDGKLYFWNSDQRIVVYDTTSKTFEARLFADQAETGPYAPSYAGGDKVLSKWRCFETEGVCLGIADPDTVTNSRGGFWLWKPGPDSAGTQAKLGTLALDGSTQSTLSVYMPMVNGDNDHDATAYVEYREVGGGSWTRGVDLFRQRPELVSISRGHSTNPEGFNGMIWGLDPDTDYEVKVTVTDPDGFETGSASAVQTLSSVSTKAMPITDYTGFGTTTVTSASQLNADAITQCDGTGAGHVFTIPADTTIVSDGNKISFGPTGPGDCGADAANPIVLRGADPDTSVLDCTNNGNWICLYIFGGYTIVENLRITSSDETAGQGLVIGGRTGGCEIGNVTVRNVTIDGVQISGIGGTCHLNDIYLADNTLTGPIPQLELDHGGGSRGIEVYGHDIETEHNTIAGFIDGVALNYSPFQDDPDLDHNRSIAIHNNLVLWNSDDGIELDFSHRNTAAYQNLIANSSDCLSFQQPWGGPAYGFKNICINMERGPFKIKSEVDDPAGPLVWNNTIAKNGSGYHESGPGVILTNSSVANNLFCGAGSQYSPGYTYELLYQVSVPTPGATLEEGLNVYRNNAYCQDGYFEYSGEGAVDFSAWSSASATTKFGIGDVLLEGETVFDSYVPDFDDLGSGSVFDDHWRDPMGKDYSLDSGSSAVGAGLEIPGITDSTPNIGACDADDTDGSCASTGTFYGVR